jgi:hypothetical protein
VSDCDFRRQKVVVARGRGAIRKWLMQRRLDHDRFFVASISSRDPTDPEGALVVAVAAFCGPLRLGWRSLEAAGICGRTAWSSGCRVCGDELPAGPGELNFREQLDHWFDERGKGKGRGERGRARPPHASAGAVKPEGGGRLQPSGSGREAEVASRLQGGRGLCRVYAPAVHGPRPPRQSREFHGCSRAWRDQKRPAPKYVHRS